MKAGILANRCVIHDKSSKTLRPAEHSRSLDSLRGMLALFVVAAHSWQIFSYPYVGETWANLLFGFPARAAVLWFFCLSGYVIANSIHGNISSNGTFDPKEYAMSRILRIVPPFLGVVALTSLFSVILTYVDGRNVSMMSAARPSFIADPLGQITALLTLTLVGDLTGKLVNGPVWSLVYEIRLYVIAGLVALVWQWARPRRTVVLGILIAYIVFLGIPGFRLWFLTYLAFGFGVVAYVFRRISRRNLIVSLIVLIPLVSLLGYRASFFSMAALDSAMPWLFFQCATSMVFALLLIAVSRTSLRFQVSNYSYTLYILHFPLFLFIFFLMHRYWPGGLARWANELAVVAVPFAVFISACFGRLEKIRWQSRKTPELDSAVQRSDFKNAAGRVPSYTGDAL
jgi:peptidoglycan/LPS O-acetylase OafA/YrhL